jgi:5-carboxymethyl-2-hydroxymuconate isomerase
MPLHGLHRSRIMRADQRLIAKDQEDSLDYIHMSIVMVSSITSAARVYMSGYAAQI